MHILIIRFFKNIGIFRHKNYFKLMNATFLDTTQPNLYKNVKNFTLNVKFENFKAFLEYFWSHFCRNPT